MEDVLTSVAGNKMLALKEEIKDLYVILEKVTDEDKIVEVKKIIMEKETYYNILADRQRTNR